jgi:hypothetical protein
MELLQIEPIYPQYSTTPLGDARTEIIERPAGGLGLGRLLCLAKTPSPADHPLSCLARPNLTVRKILVCRPQYMYSSYP